jgi:hypothetical protein
MFNYFSFIKVGLVTVSQHIQFALDSFNLQLVLGQMQQHHLVLTHHLVEVGEVHLELLPVFIFVEVVHFLFDLLARPSIEVVLMHFSSDHLDNGWLFPLFLHIFQHSEGYVLQCVLKSHALVEGFN